MAVSRKGRSGVVLDEPEIVGSASSGGPDTEGPSGQPSATVGRMRQPEVVRFEIDNYAVFDHADPDRAGTWINRHDADDPNAAFLLELFESVEQARATFRSRAERVAGEIYPHNRAKAVSVIDEIERKLTVRRVTTRTARGRDYRGCVCEELPDVLPEIRSGERHVRAWREIVRQREAEHVDGALLPGPTSAGTLFVFITADVLQVGPPI